MRTLSIVGCCCGCSYVYSNTQGSITSEKWDTERKDIEVNTMRCEVRGVAAVVKYLIKLNAFNFTKPLIPTG